MIPSIFILLIQNMIRKSGNSSTIRARKSRFRFYRRCVVGLFCKKITRFIGIEIDHPCITIPMYQTISPEQPSILFLTIIQGNLYHIVILLAIKQNLVLQMTAITIEVNLRRIRKAHILQR